MWPGSCSRCFRPLLLRVTGPVQVPTRNSTEYCEPVSEQHQVPVGDGVARVGGGGGGVGGGEAVPTQNLNRLCRPSLAVDVLPDLI